MITERETELMYDIAMLQVELEAERAYSKKIQELFAKLVELIKGKK